MISEQALPFKHEMYELAGTYKLLAEKAGVEIRLNAEVTREYVEKEHADALIIAVGTKPLVPPIPGLDGDNVVIVNNYSRTQANIFIRKSINDSISFYIPNMCRMTAGRWKLSCVRKNGKE